MILARYSYGDLQQASTHLSGDFVERQNGKNPPVADCRGRLNSICFPFDHLVVKACPVIEMEPSKVQIPHIPSIVHVTHHQVKILCETEPCKRKLH